MDSRKAASLRRVYEETRHGFFLGVGGGYVLDFMKGLYTKRSLKGGFQAARMNGPAFAALGFVVSGTFFTVEYTLESVRKKDVISNQIIAGVASAGLSTLHFGLLPATVTAFVMGPIAGFLLGSKIK